MADACVWRSIRKYKAGDHRAPETRNVLGVVLASEEAGCDVVAFVRDRDGDADRQRAIDEGVAQARPRFGVRIAGGVAIEKLEAWLVAFRQESGSERHPNPDAVLRDRHDIQRTDEMVGVVEAADFAKIPTDARSLREWVSQAQQALV